MMHVASNDFAKALYANGGAGWINAAKMKLIFNAAMSACDTLDGVADGTFTAAVDLINSPFGVASLPNMGFQNVRFGDFNGDGDMDVKAFHGGRSSVFLGVPLWGGIQQRVFLAVNGGQAAGA